MKLKEYQTEFETYWKEVLPSGIMLWKRRTGKTFTALKLICDYSVNNSDKSVHIYFHGPALMFARDEIRNMLNNMGHSHLIKQENAKLIRLTNGSEIRMFSLRQEKTLTGSRSSLIYIDEFDYMSDKVFKDFIIYMIAVPDSKMIMSCSKLDQTKMKMINNNIGYNSYFIHNQLN
jgi:hypothetical protein